MGDRTGTTGTDYAVPSMVSLLEDVFLELCAVNMRLYFDRTRAGWSGAEPVHLLTADQVRRAPASERQRNRAAVLRWARQQRRAAGRTEEDILYEFLVEGEPATIEVEIRRRGRKEVWSPEWEVLLVASMWVAMGRDRYPLVPGSARDEAGGRGLLKEAAEMHKELTGSDLEVATTLNRYHLALRRNKYAKGMVTFAEQLRLSTWLSDREARWLIGSFFFSYHLHLRYRPEQPPATPEKVLERLYDKLERLASARPADRRRKWQAVAKERLAAARRLGRNGLGAFQVER